MLGEFVIQVNFPEVRTSLGYLTEAGPGEKSPVSHTGMSWLMPPGGLFDLPQQSFIPAWGDERHPSVGPCAGACLNREHLFDGDHGGHHGARGMTDVLARGIAEGSVSFFPSSHPGSVLLGRL